MDFSSWISVGSYWGAATMGFFVAFLVSTIIMGRVSGKVRKDEIIANQLSVGPNDQAVRWHIAHLREDIAAVVTGIAITNGLLGAILGVLLFRWLLGGS
jgi:hypothetical protein